MYELPEAETRTRREPLSSLTTTICCAIYMFIACSLVTKQHLWAHIFAAV